MYQLLHTLSLVDLDALPLSVSIDSVNLAPSTEAEAAIFSVLPSDIRSGGSALSPHQALFRRRARRRSSSSRDATRIPQYRLAGSSVSERMLDD